MNLHARKTNTDSPHEQGLIIDEDTGANVAVTYESKHAGELAHAHKMYARFAGALEAIAAECEKHGDNEQNYDIGRTARRVLGEASNPEELK